MPEQRPVHAGVIVLEQLGDERGIDRQIEEPIERIAPGGARQCADRLFLDFDFRQSP